MKNPSFFAMLFRMKLINRWGLMRNTRYETLSEHSLEVGVIAHALCVLSNERFNTSLNADRAAVLGLFHDAPEIITGDMPTPIKYFSPDVKNAYSEVESVAADRLLSLLPEDIRGYYSPLVHENDKELLPYIKAADKIAALIKCIEESKMGNTEFSKAGEATKQRIKDMNLKAADMFVEEFIPAFSLTLDEQSLGDLNV